MALIITPEGLPMPMNSVQGGFSSKRYCEQGHRFDGINYPTPGGDCTACLLEQAGLQLPVPGFPIEEAVSKPLPQAVEQATFPSLLNGLYVADIG